MAKRLAVVITRAPDDTAPASVSVWLDPTPADLLTDPRVAAVVEALRSEVGALRVLAEFGGREPSAASVAALALFEEASRG